MKTYIVNFAILACLLSGCNNSSKNNSNSLNSYKEPATETEITVDKSETEQKGIKESDKKRAISELKSWGAEDAYFDSEDYLCYVVSETSISTKPYEVAKALYPMFRDIKGLKGIKVVSAETKKVLATY